MKLSERAGKIAPSITLTISAKAKEMKAGGAPVLNFSAGEPDFDTPEPIKEAAVRAMREGFTKYTPAGGILELKEAVIAKYEREVGIGYSPSEVMVSNGGKHALHNIFQAILNPGNEVIIPSPYWLSYPDMVRLSDGTPVILETGISGDYKFTPEDLRRAITPKTRILILNSPTNPTGAVYAAKELKEIAGVLEGEDILVISDDVYEKFVFDGQPFVNLLSLAPGLKDRVVIVNSVSKTYSMPGWRIGFALGPADLIGAATKIQGQATSCPNAISQKAVAFALNADQGFLEEWRVSFERRRDIMVEGLKVIPGIEVVNPAGAFYVFADVSEFYGRLEGVSGSVGFCDYLLKRFQIACVPGAAFGEDRCIRFCFATDEASIREAMERLKDL
ncbi:MAG: pyridoxal phosphate-dependent aminotransferase [Deltaproteobacteria bacterium]|nr:pyridoxal phosphate-dependent aminotransferase [Deltaproteobacteria bacterium]